MKISLMTEDGELGTAEAGPDGRFLLGGDEEAVRDVLETYTELAVAGEGMDPGQVTADDVLRIVLKRMGDRTAVWAEEFVELEPAGDDEEELEEVTDNVFCPTGPGGGVDPSCSPGGGKAGGGQVSGPVSVKDELVKEGPHPGSRPLGASTDVLAEDADGESLLLQDVSHEHNLSYQEITWAEQGHVGKRWRDMEKENRILNILADSGRLKLDPGEVVARGLAFRSEADARAYVEKEVGGGWFKTRQSDKKVPESFATSLEEAERFAFSQSAQVMERGRARNAHGVVLEIEPGPRGVRGYPLTYGESEFILPRGQAYKVADVTREEDAAGFATYRVKLKHDTTVLTENAFCPTGPGGGVDPHCSPGGGRGGLPGVLKEYASSSGLAKNAIGVALANSGIVDPHSAPKEVDTPLLARRLASSWLEVHRMTGGDEAVLAPLERSLRHVGGVKIGRTGEETSYDGARMEAVSPMMHSDPARVVRPGWVARDAGGETMLIPAVAESAGRPGNAASDGDWITLDLNRAYPARPRGRGPIPPPLTPAAFREWVRSAVGRLIANDPKAVTRNFRAAFDRGFARGLPPDAGPVLNAARGAVEKEAAERLGRVAADARAALYRVTDSTADLLSRELADGLALGKPPAALAADLNAALVRHALKGAAAVAREGLDRAEAEGRLAAAELTGAAVRNRPATAPAPPAAPSLEELFPDGLPDPLYHFSRALNEAREEDPEERLYATAGLLAGLFGEDAPDEADLVFPEDDGPVDNFSPGQKRDRRGRWTSGGAGGGTVSAVKPAERERRYAAATALVREIREKGKSAARSKKLGESLKDLTIPQIKALASEHGLKTTGRLKADVVESLRAGVKKVPKGKLVPPPPVVPPPPPVPAKKPVEIDYGQTDPNHEMAVKIRNDAKGRAKLEEFLRRTEDLAGVPERAKRLETEYWNANGEHTRAVIDYGRAVGNKRTKKFTDSLKKKVDETRDRRDALEKERNEAQEAMNRYHDDSRKAFLDLAGVPDPRHIGHRVKNAVDTDYGWETQPAKDTPQTRGMTNEASQFVGRLTGGGGESHFVLGKSPDGRAYYRNGSKEVAMGADLDKAQDGSEHGAMRQHYRRSAVSTLVHEIGHHVEYEVPGLQDKARRFVEYRLQGEPVIKLNTLPGMEKAYRPDEIGAKDRFDRAFGEHNGYYVGKQYGFGATEVISMGVQKLYDDPVTFARKDPEYFQFLISSMAGDL